MKKILLALVCIFTMTIVTNAQNVPAEIRQVVEKWKEENSAEQDSDIDFGEIIIEGQDIIAIGYIDESDFGGNGFREALEISGMSVKGFATEMRKEFFKDLTEEDKQDFDILYRYQYNLIIRMIGKESKQQVDIKLNYQDFAPNIPTEIRMFVENFREEAGSGNSYDDVVIDGQDIILITYIDDSDLGGLSLKDLFELSGTPLDEYINATHQEFLKDLTEGQKKEFAVLNRYQYNFIMRFMGNETKQYFDIPFKYQEFAY